MNKLLSFFKKIKLKPIKYSFVTFILIIIIVSIYYNYIHILTLRPQSLHHWRQADCASQALNYYQNGMHFFKPEMHNLIADNGSSGYCVEEFPIFFYTVAIFYKIFGFHELIYRLLNTIVFFCGLFALFKIVKLFINDSFWAIIGSVLFFTAPVLVFYANNFLINTTGIAITLIGWYFFIKFFQNSENKFLYISFFFFSLASIMKFSEAISIIALNGIFFIELIGLFKFKNDKKIFHQGLRHFIPFLLSYLIIGSWLFFVFNYNYTHKQTDYYFKYINSYFQLSKIQVNEIWHSIKTVWMIDYFNKYVLYLLFFMFMSILIFIKKTNVFLVTITIILFIGSLLYSFLCFSVFLHHDYYIISMYIFPIFLIITFFEMLSRNLKTLFNSIIFKVIAVIFIIFNIKYAKERLDYRYSDKINEYFWYNDLHTITPYLRAIGIAPSDKVISFTEYSPNFSLYLMNQIGWTNHNIDMDEEGINYAISHGAKYLIIGSSELLSMDSLQKFLYNKVGNYHSTYIYKLDSHSDNINNIENQIKK